MVDRTHCADTINLARDGENRFLIIHRIKGFLENKFRKYIVLTLERGEGVAVNVSKFVDIKQFVEITKHGGSIDNWDITFLNKFIRETYFPDNATLISRFDKRTLYYFKYLVYLRNEVQHKTGQPSGYVSKERFDEIVPKLEECLKHFKVNDSKIQRLLTSEPTNYERTKIDKQVKQLIGDEPEAKRRKATTDVTSLQSVEIPLAASFNNITSVTLELNESEILERNFFNIYCNVYKSFILQQNKWDVLLFDTFIKCNKFPSIISYFCEEFTTFIVSEMDQIDLPLASSLLEKIVSILHDKPRFCLLKLLIPVLVLKFDDLYNNAPEKLFNINKGLFDAAQKLLDKTGNKNNEKNMLAVKKFDYKRFQQRCNLLANTGFTKPNYKKKFIQQWIQVIRCGENDGEMQQMEKLVWVCEILIFRLIMESNDFQTHLLIGLFTLKCFDFWTYLDKTLQNLRQQISEDNINKNKIENVIQHIDRSNGMASARTALSNVANCLEKRTEQNRTEQNRKKEQSNVANCLDLD